MVRYGNLNHYCHANYYSHSDELSCVKRSSAYVDRSVCAVCEIQTAVGENLPVKLRADVHFGIWGFRAVVIGLVFFSRNLLTVPAPGRGATAAGQDYQLGQQNRPSPSDSNGMDRWIVEEKWRCLQQINDHLNSMFQVWQGIPDWALFFLIYLIYCIGLYINKSLCIQIHLMRIRDLFGSDWYFWLAVYIYIYIYI